MKIGSTDIDKLYIGSTEADKAYLGSTEVYAASGGGVTTIQSIVASACGDLDATIASSYGGTGTNWANLISSPADSTSQSTNDATISGSGTMTFSGSAGDSGAYFESDGNAYFLASTNDTFLNEIHKTNNKWWFAMACRRTFNGRFGIAGTSFSGGNPGFYALSGNGGTNNSQYYQVDDSESFNGSSNMGSWTTGQDTLVIVTGDNEATIDSLKFYTNSDTAIEKNVTYGASTTDLAYPAGIGCINNNGSITQDLGNTYRVYSFAWGNSFLTDTEAADIRDFYEARHSRTY